MGEIKKSFYQQGAGAHMFDVSLKESHTRRRKEGEGQRGGRRLSADNIGSLQGNK